VKFFARVYAHPDLVHGHLHPSLTDLSLPLEHPADGSLHSDFSLISFSDRGLHRGRGAIPLEPSNGGPSRAIPGPAGVIQDMSLHDTYKGREAFSKIKALVRKEGARVREALVEAIGRALSAVTNEDAAGWFAHAGYRPQDQSL
jgi:hypothetical protein